MAEKTQEPAPESCIRCGHLKTEHRVVPVVGDTALEVWICPSSVFMLDTLQKDLEAA